MCSGFLGRKPYFLFAIDRAAAAMEPLIVELVPMRCLDGVGFARKDVFVDAFM